MKILLLSMPDCVKLIDSLVRFPNLGIVSLAGSLTNHEVRVLDLVTCKGKVEKTVVELINEFKPELVGLSAMTFQFDTLIKIAALIKGVKPEIRIAAGGYHVSLLYDELAKSESVSKNLDYLVRGEGEFTFAELVLNLEKGNAGDMSEIAGLSWKGKSGWNHNPDRELADLEKVPLPARDRRICKDFYFLNNRKFPLDVMETSRGCPFNCKFCCITQMYGKVYRKYPVARVISDIKNMKKHGIKGIFITDDNITYDIPHFKELCNAIIDNGLSNIFFMVQTTAAGLAANPDLVELMNRANFRMVFVGFESMNPATLKEMSKPTSPETNRKTARLLRANKIGIVASIIVGHPDDDRKSISENFRNIRKLHPDIIYPLYLTPYPKTKIREELLKEGLVVNTSDYSRYDCFSSCNVKTRHLSQEEVFVCLRKEMLHDFFDPKHLFQNYFLKNWGFSFVWAIAHNLLRTLLDILFGSGRSR